MFGFLQLSRFLINLDFRLFAAVVECIEQLVLLVNQPAGQEEPRYAVVVLFIVDFAD